MADDIIELNEGNFETNVKKGRWVIDFWAAWCGPCKIMTPHFEVAAKEYQGKINFAKINVDENYEIANKFEIMSIPALLLLEDGEVMHASVGAMNKDQIIETIDNTFQ